MPQVSPGTVLLALVVVLGAAWAGGLLRPHYAEGRLAVRVWRRQADLLDLDLRDAWLLLGLALVMGWAVATAVEHSAWVPDTEGRLVPAFALATIVGWVIACARVNRLGYLLVSLATIVVGLALLTPSPLTSGGHLAALQRWLEALPGQTNLMLLMGLVLMFFVTGLWTSWWIFVRRNGLVALLPTGTILAVEIINDVTITQTFFTLVWLAAAAGVLLRLNFVSLKETWRARRLPHAADTGWTFGEVGVEATVGILVVAFIIIPPLSSTDISATFIPALRSDSLLHPFGLGSSGSHGGGPIGSIGYSETVRPGTQLRARSVEVMVVSGDTPSYYPYWRGIALGGWDGIAWYPLPSTIDVPVRQQPLVASGANIPRDDLPRDASRVQVFHDTFKMLVAQDQTRSTIFSAGEVVSVRGQGITVRGIMTSAPAPGPGPTPALVNVAGDGVIVPFDTIDQIRMARSASPAYSFTVTEAVPNADVEDLKNAGTNYPQWVTPYTTLYQDNRIAQGYSIDRDADIAGLARQIVNQAGAITPYDQAKAIESWFQQKGRFTYTLTPPPAPVGVRPLDWFLFNSKKGFCQDFSTAMNVMLRTLGIPSRQMSGFSQGVLDEKTHQYSVNALDAHSWVEVYFPGFGWLPFEPTPDGTNGPINRPATKADLNLPIPATTEATPRVRPGLRENTAPSGSVGAATPFADIWRPLITAGGVLLLIALLLLLLGLRWLFSARDLPRIWRRLLFLGDRLRVGRQAGDTPTEFGGRLASSLPELDPQVRRLASLYTRASFRQGGLTTDELAEARRAWARIRGSYAGLVARAWRDAARNGRAVSEAEAAGSRNRAPSRRR